MKKEKIAWAALFIIAAIVLIAGKLGYLGALGNIGVFWHICAIFLVVIAIKSLVSRSFTGFFFALAFIGIIYSDPLGIEKIVPWTILGAALLLSIGFSMLFSKRRLHKREYAKTMYEHVSTNMGDRAHDDDFAAKVDHADQSEVYCDCRFSSQIKYVDSKDFRKASVDCSFGGVKVYLDQAQIQGDSAQIEVNISFGGLELYIPKSWRVESKVIVFVGGIDEKSGVLEPEEKRLILTGNVNFAGIKIYYV